MKEYRLQNSIIVDDADREYGSVVDFLEDEYDLVTALKQELTNYTNVYHGNQEKNDLRKKIGTDVEKHFNEVFKKDEELDENEIDKEMRKMTRKYKEYGSNIENLIRKEVTNIFKKSKTGGDDMFKNLKEAKMFTAHLDSLANEIENLDDVSTDMRKHLAHRLDRLSDLIEGTLARKEAAMDKEANGVGSGSWAYDQDEARYMSSMGGTGALKRDADEDYMNLYKSQAGLAADHQEVLKRTEPAKIQGAGAKVKQPSDNYNEAAVANKLRDYVKKAMTKLK
ncbi:hypothetical protein N9948_01115 [bacterium]|nr:hypothetical protein [bacterium]